MKWLLLCAVAFCGCDSLGDCQRDEHCRPRLEALVKERLATELAGCRRSAIAQVKREAFASDCFRQCAPTASVVDAAGDDPEKWRCGCTLTERRVP